MDLLPLMAEVLRHLECVSASPSPSPSTSLQHNKGGSAGDGGGGGGGGGGGALANRALGIAEDLFALEQMHL